MSNTCNISVNIRAEREDDNAAVNRIRSVQLYVTEK